MFRLWRLRLAPKPRRTNAVDAIHPTDLFAQMQLGISVPAALARNFILRFFSREIGQRGISEARIGSLDQAAVGTLLRQLFYDRYFSVPFVPFALDLEFTSLPRFKDGVPNQAIVELAIYSPDRDCSFSSLVKPHSEALKMDPEVTAMTNITDQMLAKEGRPFADVWRDAVAFMESCASTEEHKSRMLLLSHGGRLADQGMLQWACQNVNSPMPSSMTLGDAALVVRDLHRKRPVTSDKHPPTWRLDELGAWLKLTQPTTLHRAEVDAKLTWEVLATSLDRYGDETLTAKQQLVGRFFDQAGKKLVEGITTTTRMDDAAHPDLDIPML